MTCARSCADMWLPPGSTRCRHRPRWLRTAPYPRVVTAVSQAWPPRQGLAPSSGVTALTVDHRALMHPVVVQLLEPLAAALAADRCRSHPLGRLLVARPRVSGRGAFHWLGEVGV